MILLKNGALESDEVNNGANGSRRHRRGSRSTRQKLLAELDFRCKLVDFGNACWT